MTSPSFLISLTYVIYYSIPIFSPPYQTYPQSVFVKREQWKNNGSKERIMEINEMVLTFMIVWQDTKMNEKDYGTNSLQILRNTIILIPPKLKRLIQGLHIKHCKRNDVPLFTHFSHLGDLLIYSSYFLSIIPNIYTKFTSWYITDVLLSSAARW